MRRLFRATAPDGTVFTRRSHRGYTHAVIERREKTQKWFLRSFHGSRELAEKEHRVASRNNGNGSPLIREYRSDLIEIVPVNLDPSERDIIEDKE